MSPVQLALRVSFNSLVLINSETKAWKENRMWTSSHSKPVLHSQAGPLPEHCPCFLRGSVLVLKGMWGDTLVARTRNKVTKKEAEHLTAPCQARKGFWDAPPTLRPQNSRSDRGGSRWLTELEGTLLCGGRGLPVAGVTSESTGCRQGTPWEVARVLTQSTLVLKSCSITPQVTVLRKGCLLSLFA